MEPVDVENDSTDKEHEDTNTSKESSNSVVTSTTEGSKKKTRKKITVESHLNNYKSIIDLLDNEIDRRSRTREKGIRVFRSVRKTLKKMEKEVDKIAAKRPVRNTNKRTNGGFMKTLSISDQLLKFLNLEEGTKLSRVDATRAICVYAHLQPNESREEILRWKYLNPDGSRDLQNPLDKKSILPDDALSKLLDYETYKSNVLSGKVKEKRKDNITGNYNVVTIQNPNLTYCVIQRLINRHFV